MKFFTLWLRAFGIPDGLQFLLRFVSCTQLDLYLLYCCNYIGIKYVTCAISWGRCSRLLVVMSVVVVLVLLFISFPADGVGWGGVPVHLFFVVCYCFLFWIDKEHFRVPTVCCSLASCHVMLCNLDDAFGRALLNYRRINKITDLYWIVHDPLTFGCSAGKEYHTFTESQLSLVSTSPPVHPLLRYFNPVHIPGPVSPVSFHP